MPIFVTVLYCIRYAPRTCGGDRKPKPKGKDIGKKGSVAQAVWLGARPSSCLQIAPAHPLTVPNPEPAQYVTGRVLMDDTESKVAQVSQVHCPWLLNVPGEDGAFAGPFLFLIMRDVRFLVINHCLSLHF